MIKISTLYKKNPENLGLVINEINPENEWVFSGEAIATRKFDGTAAAVIGGKIYKRYDVKKGKQVPQNSIPCQEPDPITGHWPHWVLCDLDNPSDKYFIKAYHKLMMEGNLRTGTYELCGPKIQGNPEKLDEEMLIKHGSEVLDVTDKSFEGLKQYFLSHDIEGIVFYNTKDGRMCKIRKSDFGIKR